MHRPLSGSIPLLTVALVLSSIGLGSAPAAADVIASPAQRGVVIADEQAGSVTDTVTVTNNNDFAAVISPSQPTITDVSDFDDTITQPTLAANTCNAVLIFAQATCTFDIVMKANNVVTGDQEGGTLTVTDEISVRRLFGPFLPSVFVNIDVGVLDVPEPSGILILGAGLIGYALIRRTAAGR